jgi:hypothetical protein
MIGNRGGNHFATFLGAATMSTLNAQVYISGSNTVSELTAATSTVIPIGTVVQKCEGAQKPVGIDLLWPTKVGIAGAGVTAGGRLVVQSATGYLINAAGTLTTNVVVGIAIRGGSASGTKVEYFPLIQSGQVIA